MLHFLFVVRFFLFLFPRSAFFGVLVSVAVPWRFFLPPRRRACIFSLAAAATRGSSGRCDSRRGHGTELQPITPSVAGNMRRLLFALFKL